MTISKNLDAYEKMVEHIKKRFAGSAYEEVIKKVFKRGRALLLGLLQVVDEKILVKAIEKAKEYL